MDTSSVDDGTVFESVPNSRQNPLLSVRKFAEYSKRRFRWAGTKRSFARWLELRVERKLFRPAYHHNGTSYFSTYQVWQIDRLSNEDLDSEQPTIFREFEVILQLLVKIQDFYLPEVRSDQRFGEHHNYHGSAAIGGTYFCTKTQYLLSTVREARQHDIESGNFSPAEIVSQVGLDVPMLIQWVRRLLAFAESIDPLLSWRELIRYFSYGKRQRLKFEALLAQDYYETAEILKLFITDLDSGSDLGALVDLSDLAPREHASKIPQWKVERYGESLSRPYEMLEFLSNEYDLNPKPRAVILTEGEEWKAVKKLYSYYGYSPELLGMEFRSISGEGNFSLANWQYFIEYMHEKGTLVYFLLDKEGRAVKEAKRLLKRQRTFAFQGLKKVIPAKDRIRIWAQSFEESNFTDAEIKRALARQGIQATSRQVAAVRTAARKKGLINALSAKLEVIVDKPRLDVDLADELISQRQKCPNVKSIRPIEKFVKRSGDLIMLNHQPAGQDIQRLNMETGLLG